MTTAVIVVLVFLATVFVFGDKDYKSGWLDDDK